MSVKHKSGRNSAEGNKLSATQAPIDDKKKGGIKSKLRKFFSRTPSTSGNADVDDAEGPNTGDEDFGNLSSSSSRLKSASLEDITAPANDSKQNAKQPHFHRSMEGIADAFKADLNASIRKGKLQSSNTALKAASTPPESMTSHSKQVKGLPPLPVATKTSERLNKDQEIKSPSNAGVVTELNHSPTMHRKQHQNRARSIDFSDTKQEEDKTFFDLMPSMPTTRAPPLPTSAASKGGRGRTDQSESMSLTLDPLPSLTTPLANASQKDRISVGRQRNRRPMTVAQRQSDEKDTSVDIASLRVSEKAVSTGNAQIPFLPPMPKSLAPPLPKQRTNSVDLEDSQDVDEDVDDTPVNSEQVTKTTKKKSRRSIDGGTPSRKSRKKAAKSEEVADPDLVPDEVAAAARRKSDDDVQVSVGDGDEMNKPSHKHKKHRVSKIASSDDQLQDSDDLLESPGGPQAEEQTSPGEPSVESTKSTKRRKSKKKSSKMEMARSASVESLDDLGGGEMNANVEVVAESERTTDQDLDAGSAEQQSTKKKKSAKERKKHRDRGDSETAAEAEVELSVEVQQLGKQTPHEQIPVAAASNSRSNGGHAHEAPSEHVTTVQIQELTLDDAFNGSMKLNRSEPVIRRPAPLGASVTKPPLVSPDVERRPGIAEPNPPELPERKKDERKPYRFGEKDVGSPDVAGSKLSDFERKRYEAKSPDLERKKFDAKASDPPTGQMYILKQSDFTGTKSPDFERKKYEAKSPDFERKKVEPSLPDSERKLIKRSVLVDDEKKKMNDIAKELGTRVSVKVLPTKEPTETRITKPATAIEFGSMENLTGDSEGELIQSSEKNLKKTKKGSKDQEQAVELDDTAPQKSPRRGSGDELKTLSTAARVVESAVVAEKPHPAPVKDLPKLPKVDLQHVGTPGASASVKNSEEKPPARQQQLPQPAPGDRPDDIVVKKKPLPAPPTQWDRLVEDLGISQPAVRTDPNARPPPGVAVSGFVDSGKPPAKSTVSVLETQSAGTGVAESGIPAKRPPPVPPKKVKAEPARVVAPSQPTVLPPAPPPKPLKKPMMENAEPAKRDFVRDVLLDSRMAAGDDEDDDDDNEAGGNKAISFSKAAQFRWSERQPSAAKRNSRLSAGKLSSPANGDQAKAELLKKEIASLAAAKVAANLEEKENNKSGTTAAVAPKNSTAITRDRPSSITEAAGDNKNSVNSSAYNPRPFLRPAAPKPTQQPPASVATATDAKSADRQGVEPAAGSDNAPEQQPPWYAMARMKSTNWSKRFPKSDKASTGEEAGQ